MIHFITIYKWLSETDFQEMTKDGVPQKLSTNFV